MKKELLKKIDRIIEKEYWGMGHMGTEVIIALLAKQVIYTKTIRNVVVASLVISLALAILAIVPFII